MEFFSPDFISALLSVIMIDLVLGGDNAIIIGLAARNLPQNKQKKAILWGTLGAVLIRIVATLLVVWLLKIPGLLLAGGLLLIWMAYKLLVEEKKEHQTKESTSLWVAIRTIMVADAAMGIDNMLAVAGAAHSNFLIVVFGLLVSIPIVVLGSTVVIKLIERFPFIIYLGSMVIAYTAGSMIVEEPILHSFFATNAYLEWLVISAIVLGVIISGRLKMHVKLQTNH
ncbi:TerC family protein [Desulfosporosinus sp. OT]|uniref:TerC family protein n=1 Tax=Desulfosporosinus sp. OT TaxID=913865 RepID=UPI0002239F37|nr:TerC family protein [Desulfosporosinus sp. OT]EGW35959.1 integral membrane TerC family protein [Desulfosporosinus sp. OT]